MTADDIRADLDALPDVASDDGALRDDETRSVRQWPEHSTNDAEAQDPVDALLDAPGQSPEEPRRQTRRRSGLGRGLGDLIPNDDRIPVPTHLQSDAGQRLTIVRVAVVESMTGVSVEIEDGAGMVHSEPVDHEEGIDAAVINGVVAILAVPSDARIDVTDVETRDGSVLLVTASLQGERTVGAALVEYGRPFALARAGLAALLDL